MSSIVVAGDTSGSITLQAPAVAGSTVLTLPATSGTVLTSATGQTLTSPVIAGTPTGVGVLTSGTAVASTSGTAIDFTGIPSWVKRITVMFNQVSLSATSHLLVQIGSGSVNTTGYIGSSSEVSTTAPNTTSGITSTAGFPVYLGVAASSAFGNMTLSYQSVGGTWLASHAVGKNTASANGGGVIVLGGTLDRLRLTTVSGTDTFDAGTINIMYE